MIKRITLSLLLAFVFISNQADAEETPKQLSKQLTTIVAPSPIVRIAPKYPINAARHNREGWARLSFVIGIDGKVSDVLVTETSGSSDFAKAAKHAILSWEYKPASENGEPIEQCANSVQMDFRMGSKGSASTGEKGVTRRFNRQYEEAKQALANKDYEQVDALLDKMSQSKKMHLSESNYMHILAAEYAKTTENKQKQLYHLNRVTRSILPEAAQLSILNDMFTTELSLNKFRSLKRTYNSLMKLESAKPYADYFKNTLAKVEALIASKENIIHYANIKEKYYWHTALVRNEFSLTNIEGSLNKLDVRCANKHHIFTVENNNTWKLPETWKNCSIYIYGDDNTQFNLVELPSMT